MDPGILKVGRKDKVRASFGSEVLGTLGWRGVECLVGPRGLVPRHSLACRGRRGARPLKQVTTVRV